MMQPDSNRPADPAAAAAAPSTAPKAMAVTKPAAKPARKRAPKASAEVQPAVPAKRRATAVKKAPTRATQPAAAVKAAKATKPSPAPVSPARPAAPVAIAAKAAKPKEKLVRDSFTMPRADFALIQQLKDRAMGFKRATKKSELLRAGLQVLAALDDRSLQIVLAALPALKAGRPKKAG